MTEQQTQLTPEQQKALGRLMVEKADVPLLSDFDLVDAFRAGLAARVGCPDEGQQILALIEALKADGNFFGGDDPAWAQQEYERRAREILAALGAVAASPDEGRRGQTFPATVEVMERDEVRNPTRYRLTLTEGEEVEVVPVAVAGPADEGLRVTDAMVEKAAEAMETFNDNRVDLNPRSWEQLARAALDAAAGCLPEDKKPA